MRTKHLSSNIQFQGIIEKHIAAMSREITDELARSLLGRLGDEIIANAPSEVAVVERVPQPTYDKNTRKWGCGRCRNYFDLRKRAVTAHIRFCPGVLASISSAVREKFTPDVPPKPTKSRKKRKT